jgi:hypothetical protein
MANLYYSTTRGAGVSADAVVVGSSSTASADFELRVLSTNTPTRKDVELAIRAIRNRLLDPRYSEFPGL